MTEDWEAIRKALENSNYKWRTIQGVAKESGKAPAIVAHVIWAHPDVVIKSSIPSASGAELFTTRKHYRVKATAWQRIISSVKNKVE